MPLNVVVCILGKRNTLAALYISYSVVDDHRHAFCSRWPLKGRSQLLTSSNGERANSSKGAHLSYQRQNMKGNDSTDQGKTKHT